MTRDKQVTYERAIPVRYETEILVAGGGPAGVAAALVVEKHAGSRDIEVRELQRRLKAMGAFLLNFAERKK